MFANLDAVASSALDRFVEKVTFTDEGCWLWTAALDRGGYGVFRVDGRSRLAHRWIYELIVDHPGELTLDHLCRVRSCVNPDHLEPVTGRVNVLRGVSMVAVQAVATHCPQGHPYDAANTYVIPSTGSRQCKACARATQNERAARYRARKRAVAA